MLSQRLSTTLTSSRALLLSCNSKLSSRHVSISASVPEVITEMHRNKQHRAYLVWDSEIKQIKSSHPMWNKIAASLMSDKRDFHQHEGIFLEVGAQSGLLMSATLHSTVRGQGAGGVRFWPYATMHEMIRDGLRLSQGMGRKNALAGLWHGGGKGTIARPLSNPAIIDVYAGQTKQRNVLFEEYGAFVSSLQGCYVTAEDVGVCLPDMAHVFAQTRFTTCIPAAVGGSGNPSVLTGYGVAAAMEGALDFRNEGGLADKVVAIQGVGNVAQPLIRKLLERKVKKVIVTDINPVTVATAKRLFAGQPVQISLVSAGDNSVLFETADIVSPCALGGVLNTETIPQIRAQIVCGAANNQLLDDRVDDKRMQARGISYVPDFLANRMGITNCANEAYGHLDHDPSIHRHFERTYDKGIFQMTQRVLSMAKQEQCSSAEAAMRIADTLMQEPHPIWGHRSKQIIDSLVKNKWASQPVSNIDMASHLH